MNTRNANYPGILGVNLVYLPNVITVARALLVVPLVCALLGQQFEMALLLFAVAGFTDGLDGFLARRYGWYTEFGAFLDPLADKILLVSTFLCLTILGVFPIWFTALVIARDIIIFSGAVAYRILIGPFSAHPNWLGKLCTFAQIGLGVITVFQLAFIPISEQLQELLIAIVVVLCIISGGQYVIEWSGKALRREIDIKS